MSIPVPMKMMVLIWMTSFFICLSFSDGRPILSNSATRAGAGTSSGSSRMNHHLHHSHNPRHHLVTSRAAMSRTVTATTSTTSRIPLRKQHHRHHGTTVMNDGNINEKTNASKIKVQASSVGVVPSPSPSLSSSSSTRSITSSSNYRYQGTVVRKEEASTGTSPKKQSTITSALLPSPKILFYVTTITIGTYIAYEQRHVWLPYFNKELIQQKVLTTLQSIQPEPNASIISILKSISIYVLGMSIWEFLGLSTIPVETAAGMIYTYPIAVVSSIVGKIIGASIAFIIGRTMLQQRIQSMSYIQKNPIFQILLSNSATSSIDNKNTIHSPFITALCMKFSCFPELIKNFGSSCISSISLLDFILVTLLHGGFYTCIWTWLGNDTALHLHNTELLPNRYVQIAVMVAMITGCVITPLVMTWWIRDLQHNVTIMKQQQQPTPLVKVIRIYSQQVQKLFDTNILPQLELFLQTSKQQLGKINDTNKKVLQQTKQQLKTAKDTILQNTGQFNHKLGTEFTVLRNQVTTSIKEQQKQLQLQLKSTKGTTISRFNKLGINAPSTSSTRKVTTIVPSVSSPSTENTIGSPSSTPLQRWINRISFAELWIIVLLIVFLFSTDIPPLMSQP